MTREQLTTLLPVMIAWHQGKAIQKRHISGVGGSQEWHDVVGEDLHFECDYAEWRVKPEPREYWVCDDCGCTTTHDPATHMANCACHGKPQWVHVREVLL